MRRLLLLLAIAGCDSAAEAPAPPGGGPASRCAWEGDVLSCAHERLAFEAGGLQRTVEWQVPAGMAPAEGWPVAILYQPSFYSAEAHWTGTTAIGGQIYSTETIQALLDGGFAVLTPQAQALVDSVWETNIPPYSIDWEASHDDALVWAMLEQISDGVYGPLDRGNVFAAGMSSGGYMTSRMAASYPGEFRALVIESASWATCGGALCVVPATLPADHPPTLFVHGTADTIAPIATMRPYRDALSEQGSETDSIEVPGGGHEFFGDTPDAMVAWFERFER